MRYKKGLNTINKKYRFGYFIAGAFCIIFFVITVISNYYVNSQYEKAIQELTIANNLEISVNELNNSVNLAYLWLTDSSFEDYKTNRSAVMNYLSETQEQTEKKYIREMVDTNCTIETYLKKSDFLMEGLRQYFASDMKNSSIYEEQYNDLQKIYSYITDCFQKAYSAKLKVLSEMESMISFQQKLINMIQISLLIMVIVISFYYMFKVTKQNSESISKMLIGVEQIQKNVFEAKPIEIKSNDEFQEFAEAFNKMSQIIKDQMNKISENANIKERLAAVEIENLKILSELQKSHLDFLQSRINPHFMFNTLNMISSLARIENAEKCAEIMEITASYLRYNLDNISKTVTLRKEIENLKEYIQIQRCRYGERYQYYYRIEDDCMEFKMPCMILQPLVENAIQHGIAMKMKGGCIWIDVIKENDWIVIKVRDNGNGMSLIQIQSVYEDFRNNTVSSEHIGIRNIYRRLQLFYHDNVKFEFQNRNPGLEIIISLPWGDKHETDNDNSR